MVGVPFTVFVFTSAAFLATYFYIYRDQHLFLESPIAQVLAVLDFANNFDREGYYPAVDQDKN